MLLVSTSIFNWVKERGRRRLQTKTENKEQKFKPKTSSFIEITTKNFQWRRDVVVLLWTSIQAETSSFIEIRTNAKFKPKRRRSTQIENKKKLARNDAVLSRFGVWPGANISAVTQIYVWKGNSRRQGSRENKIVILICPLIP